MYGADVVDRPDVARIGALRVSEARHDAGADPADAGRRARSVFRGRCLSRMLDGARRTLVLAATGLTPGRIPLRPVPRRLVERTLIGDRRVSELFHQLDRPQIGAVSIGTGVERGDQRPRVRDRHDLGCLRGRRGSATRAAGSGPGAGWSPARSAPSASGGRGVSSAATQQQVAQRAVGEFGRAQRPQQPVLPKRDLEPAAVSSGRRTELPGNASSTAASIASPAPISRIVCSAAARSEPSALRTGVRVPIAGERGPVRPRPCARDRRTATTGSGPATAAVPGAALGIGELAEHAVVGPDRLGPARHDPSASRSRDRRGAAVDSSVAGRSTGPAHAHSRLNRRIKVELGRSVAVGIGSRDRARSRTRHRRSPDFRLTGSRRVRALHLAAVPQRSVLVSGPAHSVDGQAAFGSERRDGAVARDLAEQPQRPIEAGLAAAVGAGDDVELTEAGTTGGAANGSSRRRAWSSRRPRYDIRRGRAGSTTSAGRAGRKIGGPWPKTGHGRCDQESIGSAG